jgi:ribose 5-phosphate isomerase B
MAKRTVWIGNDHGGLELKKAMIKHFGGKVAFKNVGSNSKKIVRYPHYAAKVAGAVSSGKAESGIMICSTGIGMSIIANKYKGVRAALCTDTYMAKMTRKHNDSNVLCLGGRITGLFLAIDIVETWLKTGFEGGRHRISLKLIKEAERELFK